MSKKSIGVMLMVLGLVIAMVSLAADRLGIGNSMGLGSKQLLGAAIGIIVALVGVWSLLSKPTQNI